MREAIPISPDMTIAGEFASFWRAVDPGDTPDVQKIETKRAFFAGFFSMLRVARTIGDPSISEEQGIELLERLWAEVMAFYELVKHRKA